MDLEVLFSQVHSLFCQVSYSTTQSQMKKRAPWSTRRYGVEVLERVCLFLRERYKVALFCLLCAAIWKLGTLGSNLR